MHEDEQRELDRAERKNHTHLADLIDCDSCEGKIHGTIWKVCLRRPSDPIWLASVMWVCSGCAPSLGAHDDDYWEQYALDNHLLYEG